MTDNERIRFTEPAIKDMDHEAEDICWLIMKMSPVINTCGLTTTADFLMMVMGIIEGRMGQNIDDMSCDRRFKMQHMIMLTMNKLKDKGLIKD